MVEASDKEKQKELQFTRKKSFVTLFLDRGSLS